jgi:hypothetical protein
MCTPGTWSLHHFCGGLMTRPLIIECSLYIRTVWYSLIEGYTTWRSAKCVILLVKIKLIWNYLHNTFNEQVVLKRDLDNLMGFLCNHRTHGRDINRDLWAAESPTSGMLLTKRSPADSKRRNDRYETRQTAFGPKKGCIGKLDRYRNHKTCGKLLVNETVETPMTSTFLSVDYLELKIDRMSNKLLHI